MTEASNLEVTKAKPEHINDLILINRISFTNYMNTKMGRLYSKTFLSWFIDPERNVDGICFVARDGEKIAGFVVGARIGYQKFLNRHLLWPAALGFLARPDLLLQKRILKTSILKIKNMLGFRTPVRQNGIELKGDGVSLVGIAVHPDFRGRKAGKILMNAFEDEARKKNYDYMRLTVMEGNSTAISMYTGNGWKLLENIDGMCAYYKTLS